MGKLGALELNYSSDVDLIVLYDDEKVDYRGRRSVQELLRSPGPRSGPPHGGTHRRRLCLPHRSAPAPRSGSTPLAISLQAAETYYEGFGQNWERAAMIKARQVAGDRAPASSCDPAPVHLAPASRFRRHPGHPLDQAPDQRPSGRRPHRRGRPQYQAGPRRHPRNRVLRPDPATDLGRPRAGVAGAGHLAGLEALAAAGHIDRAAAEDWPAYRFLRRRAPPADDRRPADPDACPKTPKLEALAVVLGLRRLDAFAAATAVIADAWSGTITPACSKTRRPRATAIWCLPAAKTIPRRCGPSPLSASPRPPRSARQIRGWHHGRVRATRSTRAREMLTELTPFPARGVSPYRRP